MQFPTSFEQKVPRLMAVALGFREKAMEDTKFDLREKVLEDDTISKRGNRFKTISKWASLFKDISSAIKDFSIIAFVLLFVFFRSQTLNFLSNHGLQAPSFNVFGVHMALDSLQVAAEAKQLRTIVQTYDSSNPEIQHVATAVEDSTPQVTALENSILQSKETDGIGDWAIVVAGHQTLELANNEASKMQFGTNLTPKVFKKRNYYRLVIQVGEKSKVESALIMVRKSYPSAYLVSLTHWCGNMSAENGFIICLAG